MLDLTEPPQCPTCSAALPSSSTLIRLNVSSCLKINSNSSSKGKRINHLRWCYRIEGINHLQKCCHLVNQYLESTRGIGWGKDGRHPSLHGPKVEPVEAVESNDFPMDK
ncbi:NADH dehydrogenase ubiquinone 1 beta subcomplex subunit 10-B protein (Complex I subunit NDUFS6) [Trifolium repens]|nr:NADH dehydrogenase ubiquinone 1 beta subcomplex subunit 10-B protein (Complex I subunit NDUFS6) [Trifolium repens]